APIAKDLLRGLRKKRRVAARLIGVTASQLQRLGAEEQLVLFAREGPHVETDRQRGLAAAMDSVREKFGRKALKIGMVERD
ncbi:MAG TPA: hypothetical protein VHM67_13215, partial [Gemmatimonadaceae bacterium]|nr:hypothetical protein [Gemmatimonadaceae bacterium]